MPRRLHNRQMTEGQRQRLETYNQYEKDGHFNPYQSNTHTYAPMGTPYHKPSFGKSLPKIQQSTFGKIAIGLISGLALGATGALGRNFYEGYIYDPDIDEPKGYHEIDETPRQKRSIVDYYMRRTIVP